MARGKSLLGSRPLRRAEIATEVEGRIKFGCSLEPSFRKFAHPNISEPKTEHPVEPSV